MKYNKFIPCFTPGTFIATKHGEKLVETLTKGTKVLTRDNGYQEIVWIQSIKITPHDLAVNPNLAPIHIPTGSITKNGPSHDLLVSPNHRILHHSSRHGLLYQDDHEVLVSAKFLCGTQGITPIRVSSLVYIHFMLENHEVVLSNECWTESFHYNERSREVISSEQEKELLKLFPSLDQKQTARKVLKKHELLYNH